MKRFALLFMALSLPASSAFAWDTLISCEGGKFLVEKQCYSGPSEYGSPNCYSSDVQMVIRDANIQNYFAGTHAFGGYSHPNRFEGFASPRYPEMLVKLDNIRDWGMSGGINYVISIPYSDDNLRISYYINYVGPHSVKVTAVADRSSVYNIVHQGELANFTYNDCSFAR